MSKQEVIHLAAEAGKIILENGGETYRVEQTITMLCNSYGLPNTESFVTPTGIMISITDEDNETISIIKRINSRTVNLKKVALVNELSRSIYTTPLPIEKVKKELDYINALPRYGYKVTTFFSALSAGSFTLLFGGNIKDFCVAFFIGALIHLLSSYLNRLEVNSFIVNMLGGSLAAFVALLISSLGKDLQQDKIIIGSIMLLVPGLAITNAIRDTIAGDLVSGISRSIEAFFVAIAIAIGTGIVFKLWIILIGGVSL